MKNIVDVKFIQAHQDEILLLGDIVPYCIMKYIPIRKVQEYFEYNLQNDNFFDEFETVDEWIYSEKLVLNGNFPEDIIDLLEEWVDCYPQFEEVLVRENFNEYIENEGILDQSDELNQIEMQFHEVIRNRVGFLIDKFDVDMPHITIDLIEKINGLKRESFPAPGMYVDFITLCTLMKKEILN